MIIERARVAPALDNKIVNGIVNSISSNTYRYHSMPYINRLSCNNPALSEPLYGLLIAYDDLVVLLKGHLACRDSIIGVIWFVDMVRHRDHWGDISFS